MTIRVLRSRFLATIARRRPIVEAKERNTVMVSLCSSDAGTLTRTPHRSRTYFQAVRS